jgi:translation elongation factor EF-1beta
LPANAVDNKTVITDEDPFDTPINDLSTEYYRAKEAYGIGNNYTEESMSAMEYAMSNAERILENPDGVSNEEIQEVIKLLQEAISNLEIIDNATDSTDPFDTPINDLSTEYYRAKEAYGIGNNYTEESMSTMEYALSNAEKILENPDGVSNEEIQEAIKLLQEAVASLKTPDVDVEELWTVISKADYFIEREKRYTDVSYKEFSSAITEAKIAYYYGQTQEQVDNAKVELEKALDNLEKIYQGIIGDVNYDNTVNINDVTCIQKYLALFTTFDEMQEISADYNDDLIVNIKDATKIQKHLAYIDS